MLFSNPSPATRHISFFVRVILLSVTTLPLLATSVAGQVVLEGTENLDFDRPESWAMKYFVSIALPTGMGAPRSLTPGSVEIALEGGWVPSLSENEQRVGFNGTTAEDLNRTSVFARPRVLIGLSHELSVGVGWVPPVDINGAEPNLLSLELGRPFRLTERQRLGLRLFGLGGTIEADFTCDRETVAAGDDRVRNPFRCEEPSSDEQKLRSLGLGISWALAPRDGGRWEPHVGIAVTEMDLEFQVDARYSGLLDRTLLKTDGTTLSVVAGVSYLASEKWRITGEAFYTPLDVMRPPATSSSNEDLFNIRASVSYRVRE